MLAYFLTKNSIEWRGSFSQGKKRGEAKLNVEYAKALGGSTAKRKPSSQDVDFDEDATESSDDDEVRCLTLIPHPDTSPLPGFVYC